MNRMVLGIVVDDDVYDKYQFDKETGRRRMYTLCGKERSLDIIEFYAGSADYAKESPELVKEAKKDCRRNQKRDQTTLCSQRRQGGVHSYET